MKELVILADALGTRLSKESRHMADAIGGKWRETGYAAYSENVFSL
jgi:hypothetical protein